MDTSLIDPTEDDLQDMGLAERIYWFHRKREAAAEEKCIKLWEEHWLPLHNKNPSINEVGTLKLNHPVKNKEEEAFISVCHGKQESEALIDSKSTKQKSWDCIISDLKNLRNLTENKDLSPSELDLLTDGCFLLYRVEVPDLTILITDIMTTKCTLCFVKYVGYMSMHVLIEDQKLNEVIFGVKNWICRNESGVSFNLGDNLIFSAQFPTVEEAMLFEYNFMFVAEFADTAVVVRLYGESAVNQLICKGFTGDTDKIACLENYKHPFVNYLQCTSRNVGPFSSNLYKTSFDEPMEILRERMSDYLKNASNLIAFVFKSFISFVGKTVSNANIVLKQLAGDCVTLKRMLAFCVSDSAEADSDASESSRTLAEVFSQISLGFRTIARAIGCGTLPDSQSYECIRALNRRSFTQLRQDLGSFSETIVCCSMLRNALGIYLLYKQQIIEIASLTCAKFCMHHENNQSVQETHDSSKHGLPLGENMRNYFNLCQDEPTFPEIFVNLDKVLRVGNSSVFDELDKNFKTEFFEALSLSRTFRGVNKDFFGYRNSGTESNVLVRNTDENAVQLRDLPEQLQFPSVSETLSAGEDFVCQMVVQYVTLLRKLSHIVEHHMLKFDINEWLTLVEIWKALDSTDTDILHEEHQKPCCSSEVPASASTTLRNWKQCHKYESEDFKDLEHLGRGAYGSADILKHHSLRRVVLKTYNSDAQADDIKREIDMLIRLQSNPHIVKLFGLYYFDKEDFDLIPNGILLEYIERNLDSFIHERADENLKYHYSFKTAIEQMKGMASAFAAMHRQGIMHRDIKPNNILLTYADKIRVCDLGKCGSIDETKQSSSGIGTYDYSSPEILNESSNYNEKTDVFSLGVTMWEQVHRVVPYEDMEGNSEMIEFVCEGNRLEICGECPDQLKELIERAWSQEPADRPSMEELEMNLGELLANLPNEILSGEVFGPYMRIDDGDDFYYFEKNIKYKKNGCARKGFYAPPETEEEFKEVLNDMTSNGGAVILITKTEDGSNRLTIVK